jgi:hypothetical protein
LASKLGIQTYQILTTDDEVCIPSLSSIFLTVFLKIYKVENTKKEFSCCEIYLKTRILEHTYTANDYRQTTDKLIFKRFISTVRWIRK